MKSTKFLEPMVNEVKYIKISDDKRNKKIFGFENESLLRNLRFAYFHAEEYEETIRVFKEFHELIITLFN